MTSTDGAGALTGRRAAQCASQARSQREPDDRIASPVAFLIDRYAHNLLTHERLLAGAGVYRQRVVRDTLNLASNRARARKFDSHLGRASKGCDVAPIRFSTGKNCTLRKSARAKR